MVTVISSRDSSLETKKCLNDLIAPFLLTEEIENFLTIETINIRKDITPRDNNRLQLVGAVAKDILEDITYSHPEIIEEALRIRDIHKQLLFPSASSLIEFIALPCCQWFQKLTSKGPILRVDIKKIKPRLLEDLNALKTLVSETSSDNLLNHVIALRGFEVPFEKISNLDCNRHPQEVAFYCNNSDRFTHQKTAVIFSCSPESDYNGAFVITSKTNEFFKSLSKVFNIYYRIVKDVKSVSQHLKNLNEDGANIALIIFQGHGDKDSILMTESQEFDAASLVECLTSVEIPENVVILFNACSTGLELAQDVANQVKRVVWAPDADSGEIEIEFQNDSFIFCPRSNLSSHNYIKFIPQIQH